MVDNNICRVCCMNAGTLSIFEEEDGVRVSVKMVLCCSNLHVAEDDGLPSLICDTCIKELNISYKFVQKCEASDRKLRLSRNLGFQSDYAVKLELNSDFANDCDSSINTDNFECSLNMTDLIIKHKNLTENEIKTTSNEVTVCQCSICGHFCASNSSLGKHMQTHVDEKSYACQSCEKTYKDKRSLERHKERNHHSKVRSRDFICENCGKGFFSKNDVKIHLRIHTGETPYACNACPKKFRQLSAYLRHKNRHNGIKNYSCSNCSKKFCTKSELKMHTNVHSKEKKYSCSICKTPFKYINNLKKHLQLHSQSNSFICNHCGRTFNAKGNLKIHIDRIHSPKSGHCTLCSKHVANMEVHTWKHTGERPLKCDLCSSSFYEVKALAIHVNFRHKNKEKHKCTYNGCKKAFPSKPMLDFHNAKQHETGIPYPCDRCSRGFYRKNDLARHKMATHKEKLNDKEHLTTCES